MALPSLAQYTNPNPAPFSKCQALLSNGLMVMVNSAGKDLPW